MIRRVLSQHAHTWSIHRTGAAAAKGVQQGLSEDAISRLVEKAVRRTQEALSVLLADTSNLREKVACHCG